MNAGVIIPVVEIIDQREIQAFQPDSILLPCAASLPVREYGVIMIKVVIEEGFSACSSNGAAGAVTAMPGGSSLPRCNQICLFRRCTHERPALEPDAECRGQGSR